MSFSPLLSVHISAGILGILSGATALSFRKGSRRHAQAGKVFVIAMLTLGASAVYLAFMKHQMGNVLGGTFAFYLVATAWMTARRGDGETGIFDWGALLIPLLVGTALWILGLEVVYGHAKSPAGVPVGMYFFMGSVMLLAAAGDIACSCAAASSVPSASCAISGACALGCSSPQGPSSWDSNRSSPLGYADQAYYLFRPSCR